MPTTQVLKEDLHQLNADTFAKIHETVKSDRPILVGNWTGYVDDEPCGCLMMDGVAQTDLGVWHEMVDAGGYTDGAQILTEYFYTDENRTVISQTALHFDEWAGNYRRNGVLTDQGRKLLREAFDQVAEER